MDTGWECFLAGALLMLACLLTDDLALWRRWSGAALLGALWGILILTNPVTLLLLAAWPVVKILTHSRANRAALAARFALMVAATLFTLAPWIARNYARFGAFIFVRDNLGLELYTGNNPCAKPTMIEQIDSGCHAQTHPNPTAAIAAQLVAQGEVPFNRTRSFTKRCSGYAPIALNLMILTGAARSAVLVAGPRKSLGRDSGFGASRSWR